MPQGLAVLATPGALAQVKSIKVQADAKRAIMNNEMSGIARCPLRVSPWPSLQKPARHGKLYGSITPAMISEAIKQRTGFDVQRRQMDFEPLRTLGSHKIHVRLTIDLIPEITVIVYREGETVNVPQTGAGRCKSRIQKPRPKPSRTLCRRQLTEASPAHQLAGQTSARQHEHLRWPATTPGRGKRSRSPLTRLHTLHASATITCGQWRRMILALCPLPPRHTVSSAPMLPF